MPEKKNKNTKRKDSKGRVLRTGEGQCKDGVCKYRYTDKNHKAMTLEDLRRKVDELNACLTFGMEDCTTMEELRLREAELLVSAGLGIDLTKGNITVSELMARYVNQKRNVRYTTKSGYWFGLFSRWPLRRGSSVAIPLTSGTPSAPTWPMPEWT